MYGMSTQKDHLGVVFEAIGTEQFKSNNVATQHFTTLSEYLTKSTPKEAPLHTRLQICGGIAYGMLHLSKHGIINGTLSSRNVLLTETLLPKISDYGINRDNFADSSRIGTTTSKSARPDPDLRLKWMAPEAIQKGSSALTTASDVWSFGILLWEVVSMTDDPYPGMDGVSVGVGVVNDGLVPSMNGINGIPWGVRQLIYSCLQYQPDSRPTFQGVHGQLMDIIHSQARGQSSHNMAAAQVPTMLGSSNSFSKQPQHAANRNKQAFGAVDDVDFEEL
eukprot:TRINITY_DN67800_c13_g10_i1.p1 TRINITY_DN67800_c13_g10~~TRINITY_DN67800_c13_g10_i1.p1  ORF type:complete len:321 (-),score=18.35 TRINITY_DN67800_c13_g10_i1:177-1007(-)